VSSEGAPLLLVCFRDTDSKEVRTLEANTGTVMSVWERSGRRLVYKWGTERSASANSGIPIDQGISDKYPHPIVHLYTAPTYYPTNHPLTPKCTE